MSQQPIERKVTAATAATYLGSTGLLAVLAAIQDQSGLLGVLPDVLEPFVLSLVPAAITFCAGWQARHTPRGPAGV